MRDASPAYWVRARLAQTIAAVPIAPAQAEVLRLVADGMTNKQIAATRGIQGASCGHELIRDGVVEGKTLQDALRVLVLGLVVVYCPNIGHRAGDVVVARPLEKHGVDVSRIQSELAVRTWHEAETTAAGRNRSERFHAVAVNTNLRL